MSFFECKYCDKKFKSKVWFEKHKCEMMVRYGILKKNIGRTAFSLYCDWMKYRGYREPTIETFVTSRHFVSVIKFVKFSNNMAIPRRDKYLQLMAERSLLPKDWSSKVVYDFYIDNIDALLSPKELGQVTIDTIHELARIYECEPCEVFLHMEGHTLIQLVQVKKLSPWILLLSSKFMWFLNNEITREQQILLQKYINVREWKDTFEEYPKEVDTMKAMIRQYSL